MDELEIIVEKLKLEVLYSYIENMFPLKVFKLLLSLIEYPSESWKWALASWKLKIEL